MATPGTAPDDVIRLNSDAVRFALQLMGWSQGEFARRVGLSESHISRALTGQAGVSPTAIGKILDVLSEKAVRVGNPVRWDQIVTTT